MICPKCKNVMRNDLEFPTIWKCNNKKCEIDTIIVSTKPKFKEVAKFETAELAKKYTKPKILTGNGFK